MITMADIEQHCWGAYLTEEPTSVTDAAILIPFVDENKTDAHSAFTFDELEDMVEADAYTMARWLKDHGVEVS